MKDTFTFGEALEHLKQEGLVARTGWNGKGMFLFMVYGKDITETINGTYGDPQDKPKEVLDASYMKTADGKLVPWLASQTDLLSEDWVIVE